MEVAEEEESMPVPCHTKDATVAYVTTRAQLNLYTYIDILKKRAIYSDIFHYLHRILRIDAGRGLRRQVGRHD